MSTFNTLDIQEIIDNDKLQATMISIGTQLSAASDMLKTYENGSESFRKWHESLGITTKQATVLMDSTRLLPGGIE
jgi:hypothetical protein